jgi:hypothetical protein
MREGGDRVWNFRKDSSWERYRRAGDPDCSAVRERRVVGAVSLSMK